MSKSLGDTVANSYKYTQAGPYKIISFGKRVKYVMARYFRPNFEEKLGPITVLTIDSDTIVQIWLSWTDCFKRFTILRDEYFLL